LVEKRGKEMNVRDLMRVLAIMPEDAKVFHLWDGEARTEIEHVWLSRGGTVVTADFDMVSYSNEDRPTDAPTEEHDPYWRTPEAPSEDEDV
jgi:hypothetical protein